MIIFRVAEEEWKLLLDPAKYEWPHRSGWVEREEAYMYRHALGRGYSRVYYTTPARILALAEAADERETQMPMTEYRARARLRWLARRARAAVEIDEQGVSQMADGRPFHVRAMRRRMDERWRRWNEDEDR